MHQKYVMNNLKASEWYRQYNSFVPVFLRGRPRTLIAHCLERQARAKKYDSTDIVPSTQKGVFTLIKPSGRSHTIDFGIEGETSCTCKDWKKWKIPCKHFFGVFNANKEWGWNSLPPSYLQSAYLSCDTRTTCGLYQEFGVCIWESSTEQEAEINEISTESTEMQPQITESIQSIEESQQTLSQPEECTNALIGSDQAEVDLTDEPPRKKVSMIYNCHIINIVFIYRRSYHCLWKS